MSASNLHPWFGLWFSRQPMSRATREQVERIRRAVRSADLDIAEAVLEACGEAAERDPDCLNLRGVIAERRGDWPLARRCWVRAAKADRYCRAAKTNLARYYELFTWGRCRDCAALGDEQEVQL